MTPDHIKELSEISKRVTLVCQYPVDNSTHYLDLHDRDFDEFVRIVEPKMLLLARYGWNEKDIAGTLGFSTVHLHEVLKHGKYLRNSDKAGAIMQRLLRMLRQFWNLF